MGAISPALSSPAFKVSTILLVDDQSFVGMALSRLLGGEVDLRIHCCFESDAAVAQANEIAPDLILQDLVMPGLDGFALVASYRENPATAHTPVIVLSANDDAATRERALQAGANDYLVKLPPKDDLVACLRRHLDGDKSGPGVISRENYARPHQNDQALDLTVIAEFCGANLEDASAFVLILINQFMKETAAQLEALGFASENDDRPLLKLAAHRLKGGAATMGARRLAAVCDQLEDELGRPGKPTPFDLIDAVVEEVGRARDACVEVRQRYEPQP